MKKMASFKAECQSFNGIPVSTEQTHLKNVKFQNLAHLAAKKCHLATLFILWVFFNNKFTLWSNAEVVMFIILLKIRKHKIYCH